MTTDIKSYYNYYLGSPGIHTVGNWWETNYYYTTDSNGKIYFDFYGSKLKYCNKTTEVDNLVSINIDGVIVSQFSQKNLPEEIIIENLNESLHHVEITYSGSIFTLKYLSINREGHICLENCSQYHGSIKGYNFIT